ncbi:MAG: hypothetical protein LBG19_02305 [Prevotellaceae bacterium]|jgi:hypothetical protein|nr:hypothetical protein [Prevotellaceae bacterium]
MKLLTKIQLANMAAKLMLLAAAIFVFGMILFVFFALFHSIIKDDLGEWILVLLILSGSTAIVSGMAYIGLSLNIPPEHRFKKSEHTKKSNIVKKAIIAILTIAILAFAAFVVVDCLSEKNKQKEVEERVDTLVKMYQQTINEFPLLYADTAQVSKIFGRIEIMNNQSNLSDIRLIFQTNIENVPTLVDITGWDSYETIPQTGFKDYAYQCTTDCEYLVNIFNGGEPLPFTLYEYGTWYIYKPFENHGRRFILRFSAY